MIEVRELTKRYGQVTAVRGVTFEVGAGEVVGFLGPNGAGKSTTMKMLTTYLPPTSGTARVAGYDIFAASEDVRRNLGYLPENCPLYHEMKVREYLDFRGRLRRMGRDDRRRRIGDVLEKCWLTAVENRLIGHLSKGYRQRVGLADALLHDPKVLILDEPTVGLDPTQIRETRRLIKDLGGRHTVMLSTHILPEVEAVCSRVIVIASGRVAAQGTPEDLRRGRRAEGRLIVEVRAEPGGGGGAGGGGVGGAGGGGGEVRRVLEGLPGVRSVEARDDVGREGGTSGVSTLADVGVFRFAVGSEPNTDVREAVSRAVTARGWTIRELRFEAESLEEFFVKVTAAQAESGGEPVGSEGGRV